MAKGQCDLIQNSPEAASEAGLGLSTSGSTGKPEPHSPLDRPHPAVATDRGMLAKTEPPLESQYSEESSPTVQGLQPRQHRAKAMPVKQQKQGENPPYTHRQLNERGKPLQERKVIVQNPLPTATKIWEGRLRRNCRPHRRLSPGTAQPKDGEM